MHHFEYRGGELYAEDVPVSTLVAAYGTPLYVYSAATLRRHFTGLMSRRCNTRGLVDGVLSRRCEVPSPIAPAPCRLILGRANIKLINVSP